MLVNLNSKSLMPLSCFFLFSPSHRTPSDTTSPYIPASSVFKMREQEKVPGGCLTQRAERWAKGPEEELYPWTMGLNT